MSDNENQAYADAYGIPAFLANCSSLTTEFDPSDKRLTTTHFPQKSDLEEYKIMFQRLSQKAEETDALLRNITDDLRSWKRERSRIETNFQPRHSTRYVGRFRPRESNRVRCWSCGNFGHLSSNCQRRTRRNSSTANWREDRTAPGNTNFRNSATNKQLTDLGSTKFPAQNFVGKDSFALCTTFANISQGPHPAFLCVIDEGNTSEETAAIISPTQEDSKISCGNQASFPQHLDNSCIIQIEQEAANDSYVSQEATKFNATFLRSAVQPEHTSRPEPKIPDTQLQQPVNLQHEVHVQPSSYASAHEEDISFYPLISRRQQHPTNSGASFGTNTQDSPDARAKEKQDFSAHGNLPFNLRPRDILDRGGTQRV